MKQAMRIGQTTIGLVGVLGTLTCMAAMLLAVIGVAGVGASAAMAGMSMGRHSTASSIQASWPSCSRQDR